MFKIGARGSDLSTAQVEIVRQLLRDKLDLESEFIPIKSHGDVNVSVPINKVVQEGAFTSTIETALLNDEIDLAVHSFKDLPTDNPQELANVAILKRHSVNDVLIIHKDKVKFTDSNNFFLVKGCRIGTGSARRQSQLLHYFPDVATIDIRGNVETRLKKLGKGQYDGVLLASAVFQRIKLEIPANCIKIDLDLRRFPTAPAQGAICLQMKKKHSLFDKIALLQDQETKQSVELERNILRAIGGGCQLPLGVTIYKEKNYWELNLTLAPQDWRDYVSIPLTKIHMKEIDTNNLYSEVKKLLPSSQDSDELTLQNKEIIFFGTASTIAKYDSYVSSKGAITTIVDLQNISTILSRELYESNSNKWLDADWILVTSKNAIPAINVFNKLYPKHNLKIASVGFSTTKLLQKFGYAVHFQAEKSNSESLLEGLIKIISKDEKLLYLSANNAKSLLPSSLQNQNFLIDQIKVYSSTLRKDLPDLPHSNCFDYCVVFSAEYARLAIETYGKELAKNWISIGPSTTKKLQELGITNYKQLNHVTVDDLVEVLH